MFLKISRGVNCRPPWLRVFTNARAICHTWSWSVYFMWLKLHSTADTQRLNLELNRNSYLRSRRASKNFCRFHSKTVVFIRKTTGIARSLNILLIFLEWICTWIVMICAIDIHCQKLDWTEVVFWLFYHVAAECR